jgi:transposase, IS30 family
MSFDKHLTIDEREQIFLLFHQGLSIRLIAKTLKRSLSTISRELARNQEPLNYSPSVAQANYVKRKTNCGRKRLLNNTKLKARVKELFLEEQWSPEQIAARIQFEKATFTISFNTIYRAIYRGDFNEVNLSHGHRGAVRKLSHKGKTRHTKNHIEKRGKIFVTHTIHERPTEANNRSVVGHWEADTVAGKTGKACLVTLTDRKTRYLLATHKCNNLFFCLQRYLVVYFPIKGTNLCLFLRICALNVCSYHTKLMLLYTKHKIKLSNKKPLTKIYDFCEWF